MEATVKTKYNIGDELYVWHYISSSNNPKDWHMGYEKLKVEYIKCIFSSDGIQRIMYFFEGLTSFEGENWFEEDNLYPNMYAIFETEDEARAFEKKYLEKYKKDSK